MLRTLCGLKQTLQATNLHLLSVRNYKNNYTFRFYGSLQSVSPNPISGVSCQQMCAKLVCHVDLGRWATSIAGRSEYPNIFLFESCSPTLSVARTRRLKTSCSDMTFAHELDAIDFVLLYAKCLWGHFAQDLCRWYSSQARRLGKTFARLCLKALLEIQDAEEIAQAPAQVTVTLLGTTV